MFEGSMKQHRASSLICMWTILMSMVCVLLIPSNVSPGVNTHKTAPINPVLVKNAPALNALTRYIAQHFHLKNSTAETIIKQAYLVAHTNKVKPTLVLAIVAVESSYQPDAINTHSGARGLMQVLPQWHKRRIAQIGGKEALLQIRPNIEVGTEILAQYLHWERGRLAAALGRYWGSVHCKVYVYRVKRQLRHLNKVVQSVRKIDAVPFDDQRTSI